MDCIPLSREYIFQRYGVGDGWVVWSISIRGVVKGVQAVSGLALFLGVVAASTPGPAAEIEGVTLPETHSVHGTELVLNGIGLRTIRCCRSTSMLPDYTSNTAVATPMR